MENVWKSKQNIQRHKEIAEVGVGLGFPQPDPCFLRDLSLSSLEPDPCLLPRVSVPSASHVVAGIGAFDTVVLKRRVMCLKSPQRPNSLASPGSGVFFVNCRYDDNL